MKLVMQPELKGDVEDPTAQRFGARVFFVVGLSWVVASVMFYPGLDMEGEAARAPSATTDCEAAQPLHLAIPPLLLFRIVQT